MGDASKANGSGSGPKDSVTEVAEESFVRERPVDIERGTVLAGRYQIEEVIGKGGSGVVLRAFDRTAQALVALKVLKPELASDAKWAMRFSRELRLGRPVQHANVCRIFDIGDADGHRFLTMELATAGTLRDQLKRGESAARPLSERLADAEAIIAGLAAIHAVGIVHRDFKPDNLLRMEDRRLVLSDFGLATDTANAPGVTVLIGTPHYMAPEVLAGEPATTRSDVWALGVVLHEIFFGRRPERRPTSFDGSTKASPRHALPLERAMLDLCERCLSEAPLDRPADAGVVMDVFRMAQSSPRLFGGGRDRALLRVSLIAVGISALVVGAAVLRSRGRTIGAPPSAVLPRIVPAGDLADWSKIAKVVTTIPDHVYCFSMVDSTTARLVWGTPRQVEDVDVTTGVHRPVQLAPETYANGCPALSSKGTALLFTGHNAVGATEIRFSKERDGRNAVTITAGSDPVWVGNDEEFIYNLDSSHVAMFSMPTMSLTLLPGPGLDHEMILAKAVNVRGNAAALLFANSNAESVVAVYEGVALDYRKAFYVPAVARYQIQMVGQRDDILVPYQPSESVSSLAGLDWRGQTFKNLGHYPGLDLIDIRSQNDLAIILGRHRSKDVWAYTGHGRQKLTSDGGNYSATMLRGGDLLVSRRSPDGAVSIWLQSRAGAAKRLTSGPADIGPDVSPDGQSWAYADYSRKSIVLCVTKTGACRVLRHDDLLPAWPRFSPDGESLAYITQLRVPRLLRISLRDGVIRQLGEAYFACAPVWSSANTLWGLEGSVDDYAWMERDSATGAKTGRRLTVRGMTPDTADGVACIPPNERSDSPFLREVRVETEEQSTLLRLEISEFLH